MKVEVRERSGPGRHQVPFLRSLRWRLMVVGLVIWGTAVAVVAAGAIQLQRKVLERNTMASLGAMAQSEAGHIRTAVRIVTGQVEALASAPEVHAVLADPQGTGRAGWLRSRAYFPTLPGEGLFLVTQSGRVIPGPGDESLDPTRLTDMPLASLPATTLSTPAAEPGESPLLAVIVPVPAEQASTPRAWLVARLPVASLADYVADRGGGAAPGSTYILGPRHELLSRPLVQAAGQGPLLQATAAIAELGWDVVAQVPQLEALRSLNQLIIYILAFAAAIALTGATAALLLSGRIVRPLDDLTQAAARIADGDWVHIEPDDRRDEVGVLGRALAHMAAAVQGALERERSEKAFQAHLMSSLPLGVIALSADRTVLSVNRAAARLLGLEADGARGRNLSQVLPARDLPALAAEVMASGEGRRKRAPELWRTAEDRRVRISVVGLEPGQRTDTVRLLVLLEDMTEEERLEAELRFSQARFAAILDIAPDAIISADQTQSIVLFNQAAERMFGRPAAEALGKPLELVMPDLQRSAHRRHMNEFGAAPDSKRQMGTRSGILVEGMRGSGERFPAEVAISKLSVDGTMIYTAIARDISERTEVQKALRDSEERFRSIFEHAPIGLALVGVGGNWLMVNQALCTMLGYAADDLRHQSVAACILGEDHEAYADQVKRLLAGAIPVFQMELRYQHKQGHAVAVLLNVSLVEGAQADSRHLILQIQDIRERKVTEARLIYLADHDPLTDLLNRRRLHEELGRILARRSEENTSGALMVLDVDNFKDVNDTFGHWAGDRLLTNLATLLRAQVGAVGTLARLGGDEFAVLMPRANPQQAQILAQRLLDAVRQYTLTLGSERIGTTLSVGVALFPQHGTEPNELLICADVAMYTAKKQGRNGLAVFRPDRDRIANIHHRLSGERLVRAALEQDLFMLHAQPILSLADGHVSQYELLLRLQADQGDILLPGAFLGTAERFGLIDDIDRWVVRRAISQIAQMEAAGHPVTVEVNLSGKALSGGALLPLIQHELAVSGIDPSRLIFEITETAAIADFETARQFIQTLKGLGCKFALDDFGVGFASFDYLKNLPVDYLKIDGSFIQNVVNDGVDQHLVRAMVDVARGLGVKTIAEFVGNQETVELLRGYGVDYVQGFYVGLPQPLPQSQRTSPKDPV